MSELCGFTIGQLAAVAEVNVETIRYYQRRGLLSEPPRPSGSVRRYGAADADRVRFVKSAQRLGFSLDDVAELLRLEDGAGCVDARRLAQRKLDEVMAQREVWRELGDPACRASRPCCPIWCGAAGARAGESPVR